VSNLPDPKSRRNGPIWRLVTDNYLPLRYGMRERNLRQTQRWEHCIGTKGYQVCTWRASRVKTTTKEKV